MNVYKIDDLIKFEFLKIPKALFVSVGYRAMSSDAKLTYALLFDRLSLSKMNNWINENNEVYLIYTREAIAQELGISYKKAISAFRELADAELIFEKRCGRGMANRIFIVKPEITETELREYEDKTRCAQNAGLEENSDTLEPVENSDFPSQDMPRPEFLNCKTGISEPVESAHQELPNWHPNQTDIIKIYSNHTDYSPSFRQESENQYKLDEIINRCNLECFGEEEKKIFYDAIERLFYCENFKIGNAVLPRDKVRSRLYELDYNILDTALHKLHQNKDRPIKNITAYVMSTVFNCITEEYSLLHTDPYLNMIRR